MVATRRTSRVRSKAPAVTGHTTDNPRPTTSNMRGKDDPESDVAKLRLQIAVLQQELATARASTGSSTGVPPTNHGHGAPVLSPPNTPLLHVAYHRSVALIVFLATLSMTAVIMGKYEHVLQENVALAYFVPLLIGTSYPVPLYSMTAQRMAY